MYLTFYNLADYLISKGTIQAQTIVDGDFKLIETGRRNRNFKILFQDSSGLFVKQIKTSDAGAASTIKREADFYGLVQSSPKYHALTERMPKLLHYDPSRHAIVLDLIPGAESLAETQMRSYSYPEGTARDLGEAIGTYNALGTQIALDAGVSWKPAAQQIFPRTPPWVLDLDQPGPSATLGAQGKIGPELVRALTRYPALLPNLAPMKAGYQFDSLIHGDMKWDNCVLVAKPGTGRQVRIVDWELADLGDGAWDVACILKDYLTTWIVSTKSTDAPAMASMFRTEVTLASLQPSIRAFWAGYAASRQLTGEAASRYLNRSVRYCGPRLILAVLEYFISSTQLNSHGHMMLQVANDIVSDPLRAQHQYFGLTHA